MKRAFYIAVALIIALCVYFVPEEKAYRVETTPVPAPENYDAVQQKWESCGQSSEWLRAEFLLC